jgi:hypothetical protein
MSAKDIVLGAAGAVATQTYVDDVFSTYLYTGNGATQTINNGIDLAGKGGLVWIKPRTATTYADHVLRSSEGDYLVFTNNTNPGSTGTANLPFTSTGFSNSPSPNVRFNTTAIPYVSWTFRKAAKFFDVVTYTGNGTANRAISHSLGVTPGMVIVKNTSAVGNWPVWHRSLMQVENLYLNLIDTSASNSFWGTGPNSATSFYVSSNSGAVTNASGATYVAYVFAHDTSATGIIQCGSYTGNGSTTGPSISLGWEPQYLMFKNITGIGSWQIIDSMRGMTTDGNNADLNSDITAAEFTGTFVAATATGFQLKTTAAGMNTNGATYIYMAIRRPNKPPTTGTQVFSPIARTGTGAAATVTGANFPPDAVLSTARVNQVGTGWFDRLRGKNLPLNSSNTNAEVTATTNELLTYNMDGYSAGASSYGYINTSTYTYANWMFKRAPGFFDVVCWTSTGTQATFNHNLGVVPEMIITKCRSAPGCQWFVYTTIGGRSNWTALNSTSGYTVFGNLFGTVDPTTTTFSIDTNNSVGASGQTAVSYMFATLAGVSKVGSYTGNGTTQTINCGFTTGARFILIKRTDAAGDWYIWDTARGIVTGNDPHLSLNTTAAEVTTDDSIDPYSPGFTVNQLAATNINVTSATYIYLAIA